MEFGVAASKGFGRNIEHPGNNMEGLVVTICVATSLLHVIFGVRFLLPNAWQF